MTPLPPAVGDEAAGIEEEEGVESGENTVARVRERLVLILVVWYYS